MGCLSEFGKLGLTSIGNSPQEAEEIYHRLVQALDAEAQPMIEDAPIDIGHQPMNWSHSGYALG
jgi:hypothetical protein